jgi:hypothetical protein
MSNHFDASLHAFIVFEEQAKFDECRSDAANAIVQTWRLNMCFRMCQAAIRQVDPFSRPHQRSKIPGRPRDPGGS